MIQVAGVGPGNIANMTIEVYRLIQFTETVIAFGRVGESIKEIRQDIIEVKRVAEVLEAIEGQNDVLILASGDPMFFGITNYLKKNGVAIDRVLPGISSFQYLMNKLQIPWQQANFFSFHGRPLTIDGLINAPLSIGFVDKQNTPSKLSKRLAERGVKGKMTIGSYLSYEDMECIETIEIGEVSNVTEGLSVVVIELDMD